MFADDTKISNTNILALEQDGKNLVHRASKNEMDATKQVKKQVEKNLNEKGRKILRSVQKRLKNFRYFCPPFMWSYTVYARSPSASRSPFPLGLCPCSTSLSKMGI